ncbi:MAG TPA: hypothetical protein PKU92_08015, partial [Agitococcus sp.]|nr:hypothetical protein [Agitococcus sp.]
MLKSVISGLISLSLLIGMDAQADDKDFLAAREAFRTGDSIALAEYSTKLQGDIWAVYADYYVLSQQLKQADPIAVINFLQKYPDTWLAEKLRGEWLIVLGQRQDWQNYQQFYTGLQRPQLEHKCYRYLARANTGDVTALAEARQELWLTTKSLPTPCPDVLASLQQSTILSEEDYWWRLRLALQRNDKAVARSLAGKLGIDL